LSLTERGSIHRVYCETFKADSQHEVRDEEMIFLPPAGPNNGIDEWLEPRTGPRERENGCPGKFSMGSQTLAVIGATFGGGRTGFYLLANESGASPRKIVGAEALLDDKCAD
jgi:hypothetical protein